MTNEANSIPEGGSAKSVSLRYFAILYLDVLNQKEELLKIDHLPDTNAEREEFVRLLKNTYGVILALKNHFDTYLSEFDSPKHYSTMTDAELAKYNEITKSSINKTLFSDSMIYYTPMSQQSGKLPAIGIFRLMNAASGVFISALAAKHPLRGGFEIGIAAEMPDSGIYGPGLVRVYKLESETAQYPELSLEMSCSVI